MVRHQEQVLSVFCVVQHIINLQDFLLLALVLRLVLLVFAEDQRIVNSELSVADHFVRLAMPKPNQGEDTHVSRFILYLLSNRVGHSAQIIELLAQLL
jgi:hypothetical protein